MKTLCFILAMVLSLPVLAGQRVWLNQSEAFYDPADPHDRQVYYMTLPLEKAENGDRYVLRYFHANGQLAMEGFSPDPQWSQRELVGRFQTYYPDGARGASGRYQERQQDCGCGHMHALENGRFVSYYQNGQLQYERNYVDGVLQDGDYTEFDAEGRPTKTYTYVDGHYDGAVKTFKEGELTQETHYQDGQRDGWLVRYEDSQPVYRKRYRDGQADGPEIAYTDGQKRSEYQYVDGSKRGVQKRYHQNGVLREIWFVGEHSRSVGEHSYYNEKGIRTRLIDTKRDDRGREVSKTDKQYDDEGHLKYRRVERNHYRLVETYAPSGELVERDERDRDGRQGLYLNQGYGRTIRAHYVDNQYHGEYRETDDDGALLKGLYKHGKKTGLWVDVSADGKRTETHYRNGVKHGDFAAYNASGKRVEHARYIDGDLDGSVDIVNAYGRRIVAGFRQGKRHGDFRAYTDDGRLLEKGHYIQGEPDGLIYTFSPRGRMESKASYTLGTPDGEWLKTDYEGAIVSRKVYRDGELVLEMTRDNADGASGLL